MLNARRDVSFGGRTYGSRVLGGVLAAVAMSCAAMSAQATGAAQYVIQISVDGAAANFLQYQINDEQLPNFKRFHTEGAWTHNARTDFDYTVTLPNHTCMITGRPVYDKTGEKASFPGHLWVNNGEPGAADLHKNARGYVKSTFDVAHDNGLRTALFASKTKFALYDQSYNAANGAPDTVGEDNGRDKVDVAVINENPLSLTCSFVLAMNEKPFNYTFLHFRSCDTAGHAHGWGSPQYTAAVKQVDGYLGMIFETIATNPQLAGKTAVVLTADHGGFSVNHSVKSDPLNYTIPFYTWGAGVAKGADLYSLNPATRSEPNMRRVDYAGNVPQPIRNGDAGNLALRLLGLGAVPDSFINAKQDLLTDKPAPKADAVSAK